MSRVIHNNSYVTTVNCYIITEQSLKQQSKKNIMHKMH